MLKMLKKYRQLFVGICIGGMLFSIAPIKAAIEEYICYKADYKVVVNGTEYTNADLPILNYKGNTYAPFRSILEAAGLNVSWNASLGQAEVTSPAISTNTVSQPSTQTVQTASAQQTDTAPTMPDYFSKITLSTGQEVVYYNDAWCIKQGSDYFIEDDDITRLYGKDGIIYDGRIGKIIDGKGYEFAVFRNKNLAKSRTDTNIPEGSYYSNVGSYKYRAVQYDTSDAGQYLKFNASDKKLYEFYNQKYILELLSYTE